MRRKKNKRTMRIVRRTAEGRGGEEDGGGGTGNEGEGEGGRRGVEVRKRKERPVLRKRGGDRDSAYSDRPDLPDRRSYPDGVGRSRP
jgi:hypothetical protein